MSAPRRIQRQRTKGWRMPGDAVYVGRPTQWGNPIKFDWFVGFASHAQVVASYRVYALQCGPTWLAPLCGKDLVCWCPLCDRHQDGRPLSEPCPDCQPCHADVLLELANRVEVAA